MQNASTEAAVPDAEWSAFAKTLERANAGGSGQRSIGSISLPSPRTPSPPRVPVLAATRHEPNPIVTVRLAVPVTIGATAIEVVEFRQACMAELESVVRGELKRGELIESMAGQPKGFLGALVVADADMVVRIANVILPDLGSV